MIALAHSGAVENRLRPTPLSRDLPGIVLAQKIIALFPLIAIFTAVLFIVMVRFDLGHWPASPIPAGWNEDGSLLFCGDPSPKAYGIAYYVTSTALGLSFIAIPLTLLQTLLSLGILVRLRRWRDSLMFWAALTILWHALFILPFYLNINFPDSVGWFMD